MTGYVGRKQYVQTQSPIQNWQQDVKDTSVVYTNLKINMEYSFIVSYFLLRIMFFSSESIMIFEFYIFIDIITLWGIYWCISKTMGILDHGEYNEIWLLFPKC